MAAFYLDENMTLAIETELRLRGHFVTSTHAEGRTGVPDSLILLEAAERRWTVVTHNRRDFLLLHDAWLRWSHAWAVHRSHAGIVILDRVRGQTAEETARLIYRLVHERAIDLTNTLFDWRSANGWQ